MTFMLFPALLLFKNKLTLLFSFTLLFCELFALGLDLLLHQLQCLLRLSADTCGAKLLSCIALPPFGVVSVLFDFHINSRTELQLVVMPQYIVPDFAVLGFCSECDLSRREFTLFRAFKYSHPERSIKKHCKHTVRFVHIFPS